MQLSLSQCVEIIGILGAVAALWRHFEIKAIRQGKSDAQNEELIRRVKTLEKITHELQRDFLDLLRD